MCVHASRKFSEKGVFFPKCGSDLSRSEGGDGGGGGPDNTKHNLFWVNIT